MCFGSALAVKDTHNTPVSYFGIRKTKLLTTVFATLMNIVLVTISWSTHLTMRYPTQQKQRRAQDILLAAVIHLTDWCTLSLCNISAWDQLFRRMGAV